MTEIEERDLFERNVASGYRNKPIELVGLYTRLLIDELASYQGSELCERFWNDIITERVRWEIDREVWQELAQRSWRAHQGAVPLKIQKARRALEVLFGDTRRRLIKDLREEVDPVAVYCGSIQYGDPRNLDADIILICRKCGNSKEQWRMIRNLEEFGLEDLWRRRNIALTPRSWPHVTPFCPDLFIDTDRGIWERRNEFMDDAGHLGAVLTGMPVLEEDAEWLSGYQRLLFEVIDANPVLSVVVNLHLQDCLDIRRKREASLMRARELGLI